MRLPAQGRWNPEQHHRWSPRQEGGEPGSEEMELGVQAWESCSPASACSLSQELGGSGFDTIGSAMCPTLQDSELCTTESGDRRRGSPDEPGTLLLCYKSILLLC